MQIPEFLAKAAFGATLLLSATTLIAQSTVTIADPVEFSAYRAVTTQAEPRGKAAALENFLTAYPNSVGNKLVLETLLSNYESMGDANNALSAATRLVQIDPDNLKAIFIAVYVKNTQCEKTQDAYACSDAAAWAQKGLAVAKPVGITDDDWDKLTSAVYPVFRSALAKVGATEQSKSTGNESSVPADVHRQSQSNTPATAKPSPSNSTEAPSAPPAQPLPDAMTPEAMYKLAEDFIAGANGHSQDDTQAAYWYRNAAEQGNSDAEEKLAEMYFYGRGGLPQDDSQAVSWWRKAAEQGDAYSQYSLGWMYEAGRGGLPQDDSQAVFWWQKAAAQGVVDSQDNLGIMYEQGKGGLSKSLAKAQYWYEKAAAQPQSAAQADASARLLQLEQNQKCSDLMKRHAVIAGRLRVGQAQGQVKAILNAEGFDVFSAVDRRLAAPGPWVCKTLVYGQGIAPGLHMVECLAYRNGVQEFGFDFRVSQAYRNPDTGELYQVRVDQLAQIYDQLKKACSPEQ